MIVSITNIIIIATKVPASNTSCLIDDVYTHAFSEQSFGLDKPLVPFFTRSQ